jgi:hypothetical protein
MRWFARAQPLPRPSAGETPELKEQRRLLELKTAERQGPGARYDLVARWRREDEAEGQ